MMDTDQTVRRLAREISSQPLDPVKLAKLYALVEKIPEFGCKQVYLVLLIQDSEPFLEVYSSEFFAKQAAINTITDVLYNTEELPLSMQPRYNSLISSVINQEPVVKIIERFNKFWQDIEEPISIHFYKKKINA